MEQLVAIFEEVVEQKVAEIRSTAKTYREAMDLARRIAWPSEKPHIVVARFLEMVSKEVASRFTEEHYDSPLKK